MSYRYGNIELINCGRKRYIIQIDINSDHTYTHNIVRNTVGGYYIDMFVL